MFPHEGLSEREEVSRRYTATSSVFGLLGGEKTNSPICSPILSRCSPWAGLQVTECLDDFGMLQG